MNGLDIGWTAGGGLEYWIPGTRFTLSAEYLFVRLKDNQTFVTTAATTLSCGASQAVVPVVPVRYDGGGHLDNHIARVKLNLKF